jgi:ABC-2 type transport system ATP-binding protein
VASPDAALLAQPDRVDPVRVIGLTKRYGHVVAVDGLTLTVRRGEVYGFLGPNGAGKTTTLRMLVGLVRPTAGRAQVLGATPGAPSSLARIGAMVETPALYPYLSGRDNLTFLAMQAGVPRGRVPEVLETVGLAQRARDRFATYSLGMKQRLGVAAALLKDPELLLLDEPTNGLDPIGVAEMRMLIRRLGDEGKAVLLSSHQLGEVEQLCDRVGVIFRGRLVTEGTVQELRGDSGILIRATPLDRAEARLVALLGRDRVTVRGDSLHADAEPDEVASITRHLTADGIDLHEVRRDERSLEDVFMALNADQASRARADDAG